MKSSYVSESIHKFSRSNNNLERLNESGNLPGSRSPGLIGLRDCFETLEYYIEKKNICFHQILLIKKYLARAMRGKMTKEQIRRKHDLMKEFMDVFTIVDPGYSK